jgi:tetratricopeptide (TPR) repeat protein
MTDEAEFLFAEAKVLHKAGRLAEAIVHYRRATVLRPDYAEAHNNLGNVLGEAQRFEEAATSLGRAAELRPELAVIHSNLGLALARLRRFEDAAASHRRAVELDPGLAAAYSNLAMVMKELGHLEEAAEHHRRAIALAPGEATFHHNLGNALSDLGQYQAAAGAYERAIAQRPDFAEARSNLGNVLTKLKRYPEALASLRRAIELNPRLTTAHNNIGNALLELDRPAEAAASFRQAIAIDPGFAAAHNHLGNALHELEQVAECLESYDRALALDPGMAAAHFNRATLLLETGRNAEALESFDLAIAAEPTMSIAYFPRIRALPDTPAPGEAARIEAALATASGQAPAERSWLHFALGAVREAEGRFEEAFAEFRKANNLRRPSIDYDESVLGERYQRIRAVFSEPMLARHNDAGSQQDLPIFIVGHARSGTTLVEQILAAHPMVHGAGERPHLDKLLAAIRLGNGSPGQYPECVHEFRRDDFRRLGDAYVGLLRATHASVARITDKYLDNYANIGLIRLALPRARILHMAREPVDVCVSAYCLPFSGNAQAYSYDLGELGRHYRLYADLMDHWRKLLPEGAMLEVRYEDLVHDMEGGVRRILDFCGLAWDERCLDFQHVDRLVRTASTSQVRQKIYQSSIGHWRRYQEHLAPLIEALGPHAPPAGAPPGR